MEATEPRPTMNRDECLVDAIREVTLQARDLERLARRVRRSSAAGRRPSPLRALLALG